VCNLGPADQCLANDGSTFSIPGITPPAGCNGNLGRDRFTGPGFFQIDLRLAKEIPLGERLKLNFIADGFNLLNRTNVAAVNQLCDPFAGATCSAGQPNGFLRRAPVSIRVEARLLTPGDLNTYRGLTVSSVSPFFFARVFRIAACA